MNPSISSHSQACVKGLPNINERPNGLEDQPFGTRGFKKTLTQAQRSLSLAECETLKFTV